MPHAARQPRSWLIFDVRQRISDFSSNSSCLHPPFTDTLYVWAMSGIVRLRSVVVRLVCLFVLMVLLCGCSRTSRRKLSVGQGAHLVVKYTTTPGFLESSVSASYTIVWPSGRFESLPDDSPFFDAKKVRIEVPTQSVWLVGDNGFVIREGSSGKLFGRWFAWHLGSPSEALFEYMDRVANLDGDASVHRIPYSISKRLGGGIVSGAEKETVFMLSYGGKFSASPTGHYWLPHRLHRIDHSNRIIYCLDYDNIRGMPKELVFSPDYGRPGKWRFDRERTIERNGF
jgi:hypothetical protein